MDCNCGDNNWYTVYLGQIRDGMTGSKYGEISECDSCGVRRLTNKYKLGSKDYESGAYRELLEQPTDVKEAQALHMPENISHLKIIGNTQGLDVIDVGCGSGCLLRPLNAVGVELDKIYRTQLQALGEDVRESIGHFQTKRDLALLLNVIEHVEDPVSLLKDVSYTGKKILICTPDCDFTRLDSDQEYAKTFYRTQHTWYFNEKSLIECITRAGLRYLSTSRHSESHVYVWAEPES